MMTTAKPTTNTTNMPTNAEAIRIQARKAADRFVDDVFHEDYLTDTTMVASLTDIIAKAMEELVSGEGEQKPKHTPGPWTASGCTVWAAGRGGLHKPRPVVANTTTAHDDGCDEVNAKLIAAAPSMHEALSAIASTEPDEITDYLKLSALLVSIARLELEKLTA